MLHSNLPFTKGIFVLRERNHSHAVPFATITATPTTNPNANHAEKTFQLINNQKMFEGLCLARSGVRTGEMGMITQRLEAVGERMREMEMDKFFSKTKVEALSTEERVVVENMSRELVSMFLERPMQYLRNGYGDMEKKLEEMKFLVGILEESYLIKEKRRCNA